MFTGLVETMAQVTAVEQAHHAAPRRLTLCSTLDVAAVSVGDSIAVDGCCLTVVEVVPKTSELAFEAATETLRRTTLGAVKAGQKVNLERSLCFGDRLGGHLVAGHVDAVGQVQVFEQRDSALYLGIELPAELLRYVTPRGSVTLAGVSLTVTEVLGGTCYVALIPHTLQVTALQYLRLGDRINVEVDLLARYVESLLVAGHTPSTEHRHRSYAG